MSDSQKRSDSERRQIDRLRGVFGRAWDAGQHPRIEDFLNQADSHLRDRVLRELLSIELIRRLDDGEEPQIEEYERRFPDHGHTLRIAFSSASPRSSSDTESTIDSPRSSGEYDDSYILATDSEPTTLGRYSVSRRLGGGSFGDVYLARDAELDRLVAIKIPRKKLFSSSKALTEFLVEARTSAQLKHAGLVAVYDINRTDDGLPFIVSEFIDGSTLAQLMKETSITPQQAVTMILAIAEAIAYAHQQGFVHRDLKPANILIDEQQQPHVADFGLALHESLQRRRRGETVGTPAYMSPELVRGESHRLDGRSDIWSLGVIMYELLTRRRPFSGETREDLYDEIQNREPRSLRQWKPKLSPELARVCLRCLAKRMSERYDSATELAEDLRLWLNEEGTSERTPGSTAPESMPRVVPKGLRSFDKEDADFFLHLVPGPRDREGNPISLQFWKNRIEEKDRDHTFPIGILYGPSGCGKSSFVKAGLLPRLSDHVKTVYVEATGNDTESRLLRGLRGKIRGIPEGESLADVTAWLRQSDATGGKKLLVVLDQFEQWLHGPQNLADGELVRALRQCDGEHLQCLLMIRDDFWMATTRFMYEAEVRIVDGHNAAAVDVLSSDNARGTLAAFGRAYGALPENPKDQSKDQERFLDEAVRYITNDDRVIPVDLAILFEIMKGKSWTTANLKNLGGAEGIGVAFLEDTFSVSTASPECRIHRKAARAVFNRLLPAPGTNIKGNILSRETLLNASGYQKTPRKFDELMTILDAKLRLVTPSDPEAAAEEGSTLYQLSHDFLVRPLRTWLRRQQSATWRGRTGLLLVDLTSAWIQTRERRFLPSVVEFLAISIAVPRKRQSNPQRQLMKTSGKVHGRRAIVVLVVGALLAFGLTRINSRLVTSRQEYVDGLVSQVMQAEPGQVLGLVAKTDRYRSLAEEEFEQRITKPDVDRRQMLYAYAALVSTKPQLAPALEQLMLNAGPEEIQLGCQALAQTANASSHRFWSVLRDANRSRSERTRAACVLAQIDSKNEAWNSVSNDVSGLLVDINQEDVTSWVELLDNVRGVLVPSLEAWVEPTETQGATIDDKDARRRVAAAALLLLFGNENAYWQILQSGSPPLYRTLAIHETPSRFVDQDRILAKLQDRDIDTATRQACLLMLGHTSVQSQSVQPWLTDLYRDDTDPGVHSAVEWLMRKLNIPIAPIARSLDSIGLEQPTWYTDASGRTLAVVLIEHDRIALRVEPRDDRDVAALPRLVAMSTKEETLAQFAHFDQREIEGNPRAAVNLVNLQDAMAYCNWLSEQERIPQEQWCYATTDTGEIAPKDEFLALEGYRLPTRLEWVHFCSAGTDTRRFFGDSEEWLPEYAWFGERTTEPAEVGLLLPNGFGLFDVLGNVSEWCQLMGKGVFPSLDQGSLAGGSFGQATSMIHVNYLTSAPARRYPFGGLRVARTLPTSKNVPGARNPETP